MKHHRVLVIGPSRKARSGITSVILSHEKGSQWKEYNVYWLYSYIDRSMFVKLFYILRAYFIFFFIVYRYDLIHIHTSEPNSLIKKTPFFLIARLLGKKTIVHFHSFSVDTDIKGNFRNLYRYVFSKADKVIVLSGYWKNQIKNEFGFDNNMEIIYNPCKQIIDGRSQRKEKWILYAGILEHRKGFQDLIPAFAKIAKKHSDWKLVFAGNGNIEEGKRLASENDISDQVIFLGWISGKDKDNYFIHSSVFCLPSYAEGFPMSVLDAWSYGLPVITTPVGGIPDIAEDGVNCLLFPSGDIMELSKKLELMISDKKLRESISNKSIELAQTVFHEDSINKQICNLYQTLLENEP